MHGRQKGLQMDARALRGWAMIPMALAVGLDISEITKDDSHGVIPSRHQIRIGKDQKLAANEVYIGHGHHSHRQKGFQVGVSCHSGPARNCRGVFDHVHRLH